MCPVSRHDGLNQNPYAYATKQHGSCDPGYKRIDISTDSLARYG